MKKIIAGVFVLFSSIVACAEDFFIECEHFKDYGGWTLDTQFVNEMGSPYLLAHGFGKTVNNARTGFSAAKGKYNVWVRTKNWVGEWSTTPGAGKFKLIINDKIVGGVLGIQGDGSWLWVKAGTVDLKDSGNTLELCDLDGFEGRCDVVAFVKGENTPVREFKELPPKKIEKDFVVVGGGISGICTALSAARLGLKVALVQDRPMLGGANSSEVRVHLGGYPYIGKYKKLGLLLGEISPAHGGNAQPAGWYEDDLKMKIVRAEKNLELFLSTSANGVVKDGEKISVVKAINPVTRETYEFHAPIFADCTGDGTIGALAGADFRIGRESKAETGEPMALEKADKMTMGASVQWYTEDRQREIKFPHEKWMLSFTEESCDYGFKGDWDWETGMFRDMLNDFESIRDYGLLVAYSNWSYLKNFSKKKSEYKNRDFTWAAFVAGKRETRRLLGDIILTENDVMKGIEYPDGTACCTWNIDLHYPSEKNQKFFPKEPFRSICTHFGHPPYPIPYRTLYSRNVPNLFMAGRNISVTHVALGTVRVMRTLGMLGEVVGMAAKICNENSCTPREVYAKHLKTLQSMMAEGVGRDNPRAPQNYNCGALIKAK